MSWDHTLSPFARWVLNTAGSGLLAYVPLQDGEFSTDVPVQVLGGSSEWSPGAGVVGPVSDGGPVTGDVGGITLGDGVGSVRDTVGAQVPVFAGAFTLGIWMRLRSANSATNTIWPLNRPHADLPTDGAAIFVSGLNGTTRAPGSGVGMGGTAQVDARGPFESIYDIADRWVWLVGTWHEVGSGGDSIVRYYLDGQLVATSAVASPTDGWATSTNRFFIGPGNGGEVDYAHATIWDRQLTAAEIATGWEESSRPAYTPRSRGWQAIVIDRTGTARQYIRPRDLKITQALNSHVEVTCTVDLREGDTSELMVGSRGLRLLRDGEVRFQGPIVAPLVYSATSTSTTLGITARSPLAVLDRRVLHASELTRYDQVDAGAIAEALLAIANAQEQTHLRIGSVDASVLRDREYDLGKNIGEAILQLAEVRNGFWYRDIPVTGEGAVWAKLDILYPNTGTDKPGARFSFGEGTVDSVREFQVEYQLPVNDAIILGETDSATQNPLYAENTDAVSVSAHGMWSVVQSYSDVNIQDTLDSYSEEAIEADPPTIYTIRPLPTTSGLTADRRAPRIWEEFDVGDTVRLTLRANAPYDVTDIAATVLGVTVAVSDDAQIETIEEIHFEAA